MANLGVCFPPAKLHNHHHHHHHHRHLILRSLLPICGFCFFPDQQHNRWEEKRKFQDRRWCRRVIVAGLFGDGCARASDLDLHAAAVRAASIRFKESRRTDPLLIDLYAGCLLSAGVAGEDAMEEQYPLSMASSSPCHYTLATKFIDDKLLNLASGADGVKQIVLLSDGFDTRPYRLKWPLGTLMFDISPESVFKVALQRLESVGAEIMKTCKYVHIPSESCDLQASLYGEGFDGGRPSLWAIQGLPVMTLAGFAVILSVISIMATKGCIFVGELPVWLFDTEPGSKLTLKKQMSKMFMGNGFHVEIIDYNEVAKHVHRCSPMGDYSNIFFVAEQLQYSDKQCAVHPEEYSRFSACKSAMEMWNKLQTLYEGTSEMEKWRMEFLRMEEEGDEDGFEDLL